MKDSVSNLSPEETSSRKEFLINMYNQMFADINRQLGVTWQSASVLVSTFAVFALLEKKIISIDIATSIVILVSTWSVAHLFDTGYWYNRNLCIIANIERQFLVTDDLKDIQYYFGSHRKNNKMITHLTIHRFFSYSLIIMILIYHFSVQVVPGLDQPIGNFELQRSMPYILLIGLIFYIKHLSKLYRDKYNEFIKESPGIAVDTHNTTYGVGHGH
jgi:hypothetical protein